MIARSSVRPRVAKWILGSPLIVFSLIFILYPVYQGIQTGFYDLSLQKPEASFVGLQNFTDILGSPGFLEAVRFTLFFALATTLIEGVLGVGLALLLNRAFPGKKILFTALLLPIMIAPALMGVTFRLILNGDIGLVPAALENVGLNVSLFDPDSVVPLLVLLDVVQWTPFTFLVVYAGLQSFPRDVLEAAQVDGAGRTRTLVSIVLPLMRPIIVAAVFLRLIDALRTFDVIYVLTGGGPGTSTTTLSIYIYKVAFETGSYGLAAAASTIVMVVFLPFVPLFVKRIARSEEAS